MKNLQINTNPDVDLVFNNYPNLVRKKLMNLRKIILETANEIEELTNLKETLKWGEPSYLVIKGSTIRIDWKEKSLTSMQYISNVQASWCPPLN